jgi:hypothetical protein
MRSDAPRLLPVLRSQHQAELLAMLLLHPEQEYTIAALAVASELIEAAEQLLPHLGLFS